MNVGKNAVCASYGVRAVENLWTHRRPSWWRCGGAHFGLCLGQDVDISDQQHSLPPFVIITALYRSRLAGGVAL